MRKKPEPKPDTQEMLRKMVPKRVRAELSKRATALRERAKGDDRDRR